MDSINIYDTLKYFTFLNSDLKGLSSPVFLYSLQYKWYTKLKLVYRSITLIDGEMGSEAALREISLILAKEVERGAISVELEKKILGTFIF